MKRSFIIALATMLMLVASASTSEARHFRAVGSSLRVGNRGNVVLRVGGFRAGGFRNVGIRPHRHHWR